MSELALLQERSTVLVVEDDPAMLIALSDILEGAGYAVVPASDGRSALQAFEAEIPALILSDISMPVMDGIELFETIRKDPRGAAIPFIFVSAGRWGEDIFTGKSLGADDYITKPIKAHELVSAVQARIVRSHELMLIQLQAAYKQSLRVLANAIERATADHVERVNAYAQAVAHELGWDEARRDGLELGAILHDIGKAKVPEAVPLKPGALDAAEWTVMRTHPEDGKRMIAEIPYLAPAIPIVLYHHERWDGKGYPEGLSGEDIPEEARLLSIVDTFDAMTTDRPYRPAIPASSSFETLLEESGTHFDPTLIPAFLPRWERGEIARVLAAAKHT